MSNIENVEFQHLDQFNPAINRILIAEFTLRGNITSLYLWRANAGGERPPNIGWDECATATGDQTAGQRVARSPRSLRRLGSLDRRDRKRRKN